MLFCPNDRLARVAEIDPTFRGDVLKGLSLRPRAIRARWLLVQSLRERRFE
jgi:hypothetical protein